VQARERGPAVTLKPCSRSKIEVQWAKRHSSLSSLNA
jgi:hypothetical protein